MSLAITVLTNTSAVPFPIIPCGRIVTLDFKKTLTTAISCFALHLQIQ